ncbi:unnamed protein product [Toxocara canis]|uniref:Uncharacterized protein n=1 Tax=Toxocara canis TaxID=6265 RepID=A0A183VHM3_TOXCA|nr:unnamed protein product [Toxocara canis]
MVTPDELPVSELGVCGRTFAAIGTPDELPLCKLLMVPRTSYLYGSCLWYVRVFVRSYGYTGRATSKQAENMLVSFAAIGTPDELPPCMLLMVCAGVHSHL